MKKKFKLPGASILITLDSLPNLENSFSYPPTKWIIFDSLNSGTNIDTTISDEWPTPLYSMNFSNEQPISIHPVFPFADTTRAIQFSFNSVDILILNNIPDQINIDVSSIFRERYSIVISMNPHRNEIIQQIRKLFRPLFLIILPIDTEDMLHGENSNGILTVTKNSPIIFYKDTKGTIQLN